MLCSRYSLLAHVPIFLKCPVAILLLQLLQEATLLWPVWSYLWWLPTFQKSSQSSQFQDLSMKGWFLENAVAGHNPLCHFIGWRARIRTWGTKKRWKKDSARRFDMISSFLLLLIVFVDNEGAYRPVAISPQTITIRPSLTFICG